MIYPNFIEKYYRTQKLLTLNMLKSVVNHPVVLSARVMQWLTGQPHNQEVPGSILGALTGNRHVVDKKWVKSTTLRAMEY